MREEKDSPFNILSCTHSLTVLNSKLLKGKDYVFLISEPPRAFANIRWMSEDSVNEDMGELVVCVYVCVCACVCANVCVSPRGEYPTCPILADTLLEFSSTPKIKYGLDQKDKRKKTAIIQGL